MRTECGLCLEPTGTERQEEVSSVICQMCCCRSGPARYLRVLVPQLLTEHLPLLHQLALFGQQLTHLLGAAPTVMVQLLQSAEHTDEC